VALPLTTVLAGCGGDVPRPTEPSSLGPILLPAGQTVGGPARSLDKDDGPRFSGLAMVRVNDWICSGSLVVPASLDLMVDGPAYLLTAGHCALGSGGRPNDVILSTDLDPTRSRAVQFRYFADSADASTTVNARRIVFASLKGADMAILELEPTRLELRSMGVVPFVLADQPTGVGDEIAFAGYPNLMPALLAACHMLRRVSALIEAPFHFYDSETNDCQAIAGGASGSPVFSLATGKVQAVLNTTAESGNYPCHLDQPCEVSGSALNVELGTSYAVPVPGLAACFDAAGVFDMSAAACPLDPGNQMQPALAPGNGELDIPAVAGSLAAASIPLDPQGLTHYRYALGPAATTECRDPGRYGSVIAYADAPTIAATVPGDPGINLLCLRAGPSPNPDGGAWQDSTRPTVLAVTTYAASQ
jgi:hypothetical protein